jgi:hypothetical protein
MHCPNCGKETAADVKFCRVCGMKLDSVARAVSEHTGSEYDLEPAEKAEKGSDGKLLRNFSRMLFAGIMVVLIGAAMTVVGKEVPMMKNIGALVSILGMMLAIYAVIYPMTRGGEKALRPASKKPKKKLEGQSEAALPAGDDFVSATPVPSVTEATTRDLQGNKKTKVTH